MGLTPMGFDVENIFLPSVGADLVFDMNSLSPVSRSSIIYDTDFQHLSITLAQPIVPISSTTQFEQLHLTTIIHRKQRKIRIGLPCRPIKFMDHYHLANQSTAKALVVEYMPPALETNIRSAFRLPLSQKHAIKAKILFNQTEYYTTKDFRIRDISFAGMGLVIQKQLGEALNPLSGLAIGDQLPIGMILLDLDHEKPVGTFPVKAQVVRINTAYSESHIFIGLKITAITPTNESQLNQFIHNAQIDELKRLSNRD